MPRWLYKGSVALAVAGLVALGLYLLFRDSDGGETERAQGPAAAPAADAPYEPFRSGDLPLPRECGPGRLATVVLEFFDALNRGDPRAARFISPEHEFSAWGIGERGTGEGISVKTPNEKLFGYFRRRYEQGERLGRLEMAVSPARRTSGVGPFSVPGKDPIAAFDFELSRTASDLRERGIQSQLGSGKAGINCKTGRIFLWAQAWGDTPPNLQTCPQATIKPSWSSAVACAPGYRRVNRAVEIRLPSQPAG
jgi:hypothetical protein